MSLSLSNRASLSVGAFADTGEVICNNAHQLLSDTAARLHQHKRQLAHAVQQKQAVH